MRCHDVARRLGLDDPDQALDAPKVRRHLGRCARCRGQHEEIAWLLGVRAAPAARSGRRAAGAIAVLVAAGFVLVVLVRGTPVERPPAPPSPVESPARTALAYSTAEAERHETAVARHRGRRIELEATYATWSPPRPRCLPKE